MFGSVICLASRNQIVKERGKVTLIRIPSKSGKAIMIPTRYVNNDLTFWIHPQWEYKVKSGRGYRNDYATWGAEEIKEAFSREASSAYLRESYYIVEKPEKIEGEVSIDFN